MAPPPTAAIITHAQGLRYTTTGDSTRGVSWADHGTRCGVLFRSPQRQQGLFLVALAGAAGCGRQHTAFPLNLTHYLLFPGSHPLQDLLARHAVRCVVWTRIHAARLPIQVD